MGLAVKQLIDDLRNYPADMEVYFEKPLDSYLDHRTIVWNLDILSEN
jgi:hypothetical protein